VATAGFLVRWNEQMVTDNTPRLSGLFGVYLQVGDLHRSLSFYCDVLALDVVWNDGALAVLHTHRAPADSLVIREIGQATRHTMGEAGVTRVLWRVGDPAELDSAEELLTRQEVPYQRHRDAEVDGITMHDPDGLEIVLMWIGEKVPAAGPPAWLHWYY
jgi:catechol-2,3-dioxygenase